MLNIPLPQANIFLLQTGCNVFEHSPHGLSTIAYIVIKLVFICLCLPRRLHISGGRAIYLDWLGILYIFICLMFKVCGATTWIIYSPYSNVLKPCVLRSRGDNLAKGLVMSSRKEVSSMLVLVNFVDYIFPWLVIPFSSCWENQVSKLLQVRRPDSDI